MSADTLEQAPPVTTQPGADLGDTGRIAQLHALYRGAFGAPFDLQAFRGDDFYAFQILEKAIAEGSPQVAEVARHLQDMRLAQLNQSDELETISLAGLEPEDRPGRAVVSARASDQPARHHPHRGTERRGPAAQAAGHVRLSFREVQLLSQMRSQYRKTFGVFFDPAEFTGNDLYARTTLQQSVTSGNPVLVELARCFLGEDGKPRLHRRLGSTDIAL